MEKNIKILGRRAQCVTRGSACSLSAQLETGKIFLQGGEKGPVERV